MPLDIKALKQITIEDSYSKREINKRVWKDLTSCSQIQPTIDELFGLINTYAYSYTSHWPSKNSRIVTLVEYNLVNDICTYVAIGVMRDAGKPVPIHGAVDYIARRLEGFSDYMDAVRTASEILAVGADSGLYRIIAAKDSMTGSLMFKSLWKLDKLTEQLIADTMYLPPMLVPPNQIKENTDSGYLNPAAESVILKAHNHHSKKVGLDAINIANSVEFELDTFILENFEESPSKPLDTPEKVNSFMLLKNSSKKVYEFLLDEGNRFWFSWRFDKRGRMYSQGYHVNIQSTQYKKALISLANKETIKIKRS